VGGADEEEVVRQRVPVREAVAVHPDDPRPAAPCLG
jgi:hypothetical protein